MMGMLAVRVELNKRYNSGFQVRLIMEDALDSTIDSEPFSFEEAYVGAVTAVEEISKVTGRGYDPVKVICVSKESLDANRKFDFTAARIWDDIRQGQGKLTVPVASRPDVTTIDGEDMFSARGVLICSYLCWREEKNSKAGEALHKYCVYLAMRRYGKTGAEIFKELEAKDTETGLNWLKATFAKYVSDEAGLVRELMSNVK